MVALTLRACSALLLALAVAACGGEKPPATASNEPPPGAVRVDESKAGRLAGRILFDGPAPANPTLSVASDPVCARQHAGGIAFENVVVKEGGLDNVFVYLKDGLDGYYFDTPTQPAGLTNQGCRYVPHVMGVRAGQPLEIANDDETMHNVNASATSNRGFNFSLPLKGLKQAKTFSTREVMVLFKCDVHPWMNAYVGVMDHPYFAVSANGGGFELKNVPAGTYTLEAWHEKLGTQTQTVTVGEKEDKSVSFTFKPAASTE